MDLVRTLLNDAGIRCTSYASHPIWLTEANQLVSSHRMAKAFAKSNDLYRGWDSHHVVEKQDLDRLGVAARFPPYDDQLTVLLPQTAHSKRINSILRGQVPLGIAVSARDLLQAYASAYSIVGDYCGGGEEHIQKELMAIVRATLRLAALI